MGDINGLFSSLAISLSVDTLGKPLTTRMMVIHMSYCTSRIYLVTMLILSLRKPFVHHVLLHFKDKMFDDGDRFVMTTSNISLCDSLVRYSKSSL